MHGITTLKFKVARTFILKEYSKNHKKSKTNSKNKFFCQKLYIFYKHDKSSPLFYAVFALIFFTYLPERQI